MVTWSHLGRVFFATGALLVWMSLPLDDSLKPVDSLARPPGFGTTYRLGMDRPKFVIDCWPRDPYDVRPAAAPTAVFGPRLQPLDRLDASPHTPSPVEGTLSKEKAGYP